jgi:CubicO group peptidase (beta-lactamase class C family)
MQALAAAMALVLGTGLAVAAPPQAIPQPEPVRQVEATLPAGLQDFDAFVATTLKTFDVPGISVAIVKDGQVVLERGYGVRDREANAPADAHTLYAIASNTKAFTAASLQMLADDGKLKMTDRVIDHLPRFRMTDPYITHDKRIRDLLAHRSGQSLGAGDLL